ncbi:MAG: hypothetical protein ASARMPREDX12_006714 [Alectoria sarmentosa]|nr:MAG: hypothetical protein ASARMPREDX12_006714 [Alectoria sarmentosa]
MPQLRPRPPKADSVKGESPSPDHESSDEEQAHSRPRIRQSKSHASQARQDSAPEADTPTTSPMPKTDDSTSTKPYSHLLGFMVRKITKKHEKPIRDEYDEELRSLGERRKDANPGQAGAMDRSLEEAAKRKLQARLEAVEPVIAMALLPYADTIISEGELYMGPRSESTSEEDSPTDTSAEEQPNAGSTNDPTDTDSHNSEKNVPSESSFSPEGTETPESDI